MTMRLLATAAISLVVLAGCPRQQTGRPAATAAAPAAAPLEIVLIRSDLGLGDGEFVRTADQVLEELAADGRLTYRPVGPLPAGLVTEAGAGDVGLPRPGSSGPGEMTLAAGRALLAGSGATDWLVLSTPLLLDAALAQIEAGTASAELLLVLDEDGLAEPPVDPAVPVYVISYDISPVAFLCGVAAAESSNNGMFTIMVGDTDPRAQEFLDAAWAGAKYQTNGAMAATGIVPVDQDSGLVTPETFTRMHQALKDRMGPYWASNHYIVALGRATPSILHAMSQKPVSGYVVGAYADYRRVRPSRILGCALKQPNEALRYLIEQHHAGRPPAMLSDEHGLIQVGVEQQAVGFTKFDLYSRHNPDGDDLAEAVGSVWEEIQVGELDIMALIEQLQEERAGGPDSPSEAAD